MEYVATLPSDFKLSGSEKKRVLKASLRGLIPDTILDRPKMGFCAPIDSWFRRELRELASTFSRLRAPCSGAIFDRRRLPDCSMPIVSGESNHGSLPLGFADAGTLASDLH